jgi:putative endonuclease
VSRATLRGMTQAGGDTPRGRLGKRGEDLAVDHLSRQGYQVLERNWRCARGEIDIVAIDGSALVFVEVKTRSSRNFGHPLEAITLVKLARLRSLALAWCHAHPDRSGQLRIDAIGVLAPANAPFQIEHLTGVFS